MKKRQNFLLGGFITFIVLGVFFLPSVIREARWKIIQKQVSATGGYPFQIGLTGTTKIDCSLSSTGSCTGGLLCTNATTPCAYSEIIGSMAGGDGYAALFSTTKITQSGYSDGDNIIAGGMSDILMESGVLATPGGCAGCTAKLNTSERFVMWLSDFFIAGKKD